ncbi:MAG TPA: DUF4388 domain-containing protein, partial [Planctomycetota bacterium]|nr:DUF4388 domain-containing protein [Planctomycetota bacterium]
MALKGDLASVDLAQVFQMLALNKKVGLLSILSPRLWKILYFDQRGVTLYYNEHALLERTVAALERAGRLQEAALTEARDHAVQNSGGLMASLLAGGYLTEEELETQMRSELEEETYDLFFCKDARFEFFEGQSEMEGREGTVDQRFFFNTDSIIMEAARRIDEWSYISERIPSPLEVFRAADVAIDAEQVDANCMAVFDLVDGRRNGGRIVEVSGLANFQVFKHLCQLLDGGFIETLPAELLLAAGSQCMVDGRLQDAINLFEKAVGHGLGLPEVHTQAAEAYQAAEEYENAIYHLKCDAEFRIASADNKGAAQKLRAAIRLVPTDLAARERLVELSVGVPDLAGGDFDPQAEGKVLVDLFMAIGDLKRVRGVLERLLRVQPDDMDLKKVLVNVHTKAGDQKRVIELYESMADDLVRGSRPIEAIGCLQKILLLDRSRADISEKVRALYELDERSRSRRRAMALLGAVLCVLRGLGGVWFFYENHAVEMFEKIDAKALLDQNEYAKASGLYQQVIADFPLTTVVERAESELARIESIRKKYEARVANDQATRGKELGAIRADYLAEWNRHKELFMAGQPERSKESLERVQRLLAKAGEQVDLEWAVREQVEKTYTRLRDYLARANELEQRVLELQGKGDWQQARAQGLELLQKYDGTQAARRLRLPVQVSTRPKGAQLVQNGKPLLQKVDGQDEPVRTPAVLFCKSHGDETFAVDLKGFEAQAFVIDARKQPTIDLILKVVAERTIRFPSTVQTGVGIAGDHFVVGLRGGKVGIGRISTGKVTGVLELGGLKAVDTTPIVTGGRAFFLTNEGTIECVLVDKAMLAASWPLKLEHGAIT